MAKKHKSHFDKSAGWKYWRTCRLPSCRREFGTNREWQHFCPNSDHQRQWHKLLKRKHEDVVVEVAELREEVKKLRKETLAANRRLLGYERWLLEQFQLGGTPKESREELKAQGRATKDALEDIRKQVSDLWNYLKK